MKTDMPLILVTGATGFVGRSICAALQSNSIFQVRGTGRQTVFEFLQDYHAVSMEQDSRERWSFILKGVDTVIHCAARVHIMNDDSGDPLTAFRTINVEGTLELARQAIQAGVRRFIFISTIKVNGESSTSDKPFGQVEVSAPVDAYALSKWEAEQGLLALAKSSAMEVVIVRPPLVYGSGVKGNFQSLLKLASSGLPLPLGAIHNQRSMVYLGNLVDLIVKCIDHPAAANQTFLVSDARDLSTPELIRLLRGEMGLPPRLLPVPPLFLNTIGRLTGKREMVDRLCGSLLIDCSKARSLLQWEPPYSVEQGLSEMVKFFLKAR